MSQEPLLLDVLFHIMAHCDDKTISSLMAANKSLNLEGAKYLLDSPRITMNTSRRLDSLITFLSAYNGSRLAFFKGLGLEMRSLPNTVGTRLAQLLTTHVDKLALTLLHIPHLDVILERCHTLSAAFAAVTTLTYIRIGGIDIVGSEMLRAFTSKLKSADVHFTAVSETSIEEGSSRIIREQKARTPIRVLKNSQSSLADLTVGVANMQRIHGDNAFEEVYPLLSRLTIKDSPLLGVLTRTMVLAFPNLQSLFFIQLARVNDDPNAADAQHERNVADQLAHGSWTSLNTISAHIMDLYMLSPTCPVRRIDILGPVMQTRALRRVLKHTRTVHLSFGHFEGTLFTPALAQMLKKPCAATIQCLEVVFRVGCGLPAELVDAPAMLEHWVAAICGLPRLRVLALGIYGELRPFTHLSPNAWAPSAAERFLAALDLDALTCQLADAIPTLETVELAVTGVRGRSGPASVRRGPESKEFETHAVQMAEMLEEMEVK
ncbi:uncharacterized protein BXZ73DRAFT_109532 [Epithele typhae]|uniref:uncharacterized protein n=1 Tax=Epithele typhae TaxID=378194 RepID=UPI00200878B4|nr:uncharacterized protein BXZ73DRAFT_109532 [Epithele typhae]KAH9910118.1 hypothetical protein BXZ73DRAFT_109532 [Epithele typhae]